MIGGYILLNGEILAQIQSDDFDNPTEISKADFEKVYNAVKAGKELRVELMDTVIPVIALKYDDTFCSLTFAYDNEGITLLTFVLEVTIDDTDPDNPVYTYSGVVQETEVGDGGGLPDITGADYEKVLTVNDQGKLILKKVNYDIHLTSEDGVTWESDMSFATLSALIGSSPCLPLRFNFELRVVGEGMDDMVIGDAYNATGVLVNKMGTSFVQFTIDATKYILITTDGVSVSFE